MKAVANAAIAAILVLLFSVGGYLYAKQRHETLKTGDRLGDLGGTFPAASASGRHVWIIVRPNCPICRRELPLLDQAMATRRDLPEITVISLSSAADAEAMTRSLPRVRQRLIVDAEGRLEHAHGRFRVPTLLVLDRTGRVASKIVGQPADLSGVLTGARAGSI